MRIYILYVLLYLIQYMCKYKWRWHILIWLAVWKCVRINSIYYIYIYIYIYIYQQGHDRSPARQTGGIRPTRSNGPYETWSQKDSGQEAELIMCDGESREKRGEKCSVYPKRPPAAYQPIAASLGAGLCAPDSALTIRLSRGKYWVYSTWGDCVCLQDWRWKLVP